MRANEIEYPGAEPFDLWDVVPDRLQAVLPNVMWSRDRLHQLELPVVELLVDELAWQLDLPWWRDSHEYFSLSPLDVWREPVVHSSQWQRTLAADLTYPIHVLERGPLIVLDGVHRLLKAFGQKRERIDACIVSHPLFVEVVVDRSPRH